MREPAPSTEGGREGLQALLSAPDKALVALDFDGTLAPIVDDPADAHPAPGARDVLRRLAGRVAVLAIVTGRPASVAVDLLKMSDAAPANLVVLGHYGLERWTPESGVVRTVRLDTSGVVAARAELPALLDRLGAPAGTSIEDKGASVAVHARRTADPVSALALLREPLAGLARAHGLVLEPGRLVLELRAGGVDKGIALESLARDTGARVVCYAGDDLGDLAAFDAVERLRSRGVAGIRVCSGRDVPELAARADLVFDGPADLTEFLGWLTDAFTAG